MQGLPQDDTYTCVYTHESHICKASSQEPCTLEIPLSPTPYYVILDTWHSEKEGTESIPTPCQIKCRIHPLHQLPVGYIQSRSTAHCRVTVGLLPPQARQFTQNCESVSQAVLLTSSTHGSSGRMSSQVRRKTSVSPSPHRDFTIRNPVVLLCALAGGSSPKAPQGQKLTPRPLLHWHSLC